jgi:hypothetical protein
MNFDSIQKIDEPSKDSCALKRERFKIIYYDHAVSSDGIISAIEWQRNVSFFFSFSTWQSLVDVSVVLSMRLDRRVQQT